MKTKITRSALLACASVSSLTVVSFSTEGCRTRAFNARPTDAGPMAGASGPKPTPIAAFTPGVPLLQFSVTGTKPVRLVAPDGTENDVGGATVEKLLDTVSRPGGVVQILPAEGLQPETERDPDNKRAVLYQSTGALPKGLESYDLVNRCNTFSRFFAGFDAIDNAAARCALLKGGISDVKLFYTLIPLSADDTGFDPTARGPGFPPAMHASKALPRAPVTGVGAFALAPDQPDTDLDFAALSEALGKVHARFNVSKYERAACIANPMTARWTDAAVHFYCQIPIQVRTCYSEKLSLERSRLANGPLAPPAGADVRTATVLSVQSVLAAHALAWNSCMVNESPSMDAGWLASDPLVANAFRALVWTIPGLRDYNITAEQALISDFYTKAALTRPRRALDTFPEWNAAAPRYLSLRKQQEIASSLPPIPPPAAALISPPAASSTAAPTARKPVFHPD